MSVRAESAIPPMDAVPAPASAMETSTGATPVSLAQSAAPAAPVEGLAATTPSQPGQAKAPVQGCMDAHNDFVGFLYRPHGQVFEENVAKLEAATGLKREHVAYGLSAILALYLIAGDSAQFVCNLIGFAYPAYTSVKVIRTEDKSDDTQWLIYWSVFAFFSLIDFFAMGIMSWFPIYWLLKAAFLVYLYLPQTMGAQTIYVQVIDPAVRKFDQFMESRKTV